MTNASKGAETPRNEDLGKVVDRLIELAKESSFHNIAYSLNYAMEAYRYKYGAKHQLTDADIRKYAFLFMQWYSQEGHDKQFTVPSGRKHKVRPELERDYMADLLEKVVTYEKTARRRKLAPLEEDGIFVGKGERRTGKNDSEGGRYVSGKFKVTEADNTKYSLAVTDMANQIYKDDNGVRVVPMGDRLKLRLISAGLARELRMELRRNKVLGSDDVIMDDAALDEAVRPALVERLSEYFKKVKRVSKDDDEEEEDEDEDDEEEREIRKKIKKKCDDDYDPAGRDLLAIDADDFRPPFKRRRGRHLRIEDIVDDDDKE